MNGPQIRTIGAKLVPIENIFYETKLQPVYIAPSVGPYKQRNELSI